MTTDLQDRHGAARRVARLGRLARGVLAAAGCAAALAWAAAGPAQAVELQQAVRKALSTNPDVGIVAENQRAVAEEVEQAEAGYYPSVDVQAGTGIEMTEDQSTRNRAKAPGDADHVRMPRWESSLTVTQPLYDGNATDAEVSRQESRLVSATRRVRETSEFVGLDAIEAYLESLRQRELVRIAEENVRSHERTLDLVEAKAQGGAATVADIQQTESRLAAAESTLTQAEARLRDADATYVRVIGDSPDQLFRPEPPLWALPESVDKAISIALENSPTIAVTRADLDTARAQFQASKADFRPSVDLEISGDANRNIDGSRGADFGASAIVRMSYNLYSGGRDFHRRQELIHRIGEARQRHNRAMRLTEEEMRLAWNGLKSARERIKSQRREVEANDRVRKTYRQQFDLGGRNLIELLDAENEYFLARSNLINSEFERLFAIYRILATGGVLLSTLDVPQLGEGRTELDPNPPEQRDLERQLRPRDGGGEGGIGTPMTSPETPGGSGTGGTTGGEVFTGPDAGGSAGENGGGALDPSAPVDPEAPLDPNAPVDQDASRGAAPGFPDVARVRRADTGAPAGSAPDTAPAAGAGGSYTSSRGGGAVPASRLHVDPGGRLPSVPYNLFTD